MRVPEGMRRQVAKCDAQLPRAPRHDMRPDEPGREDTSVDSARFAPLLLASVRTSASPAPRVANRGWRPSCAGARGRPVAATRPAGGALRGTAPRSTLPHVSFDLVVLAPGGSAPARRRSH